MFDPERAESLAWAAGLYDGEGSTTCSGPLEEPHVHVPQSGATDAAPEVLKRFQVVIGSGAVRGPHFPQKANAKPSWRFVTTGPAAVRALELLWPYLGDVKRRQAQRVLERYRSHPTPHADIAAATGRPLRMQCRFGHSLADAYVWRGKRLCRTCRRIRNRERQSGNSK